MLLLQDQDSVADAMGFADADARAARAIEWASELVVAVQRAAGRARARRRTRSISAVLQPGIAVVDEVEIDVDVAGVEKPIARPARRRCRAPFGSQ